MKKYLVTDYYCVTRIVEAEDPISAKEKTEVFELELSELEYQETTCFDYDGE